MHRLETGIAFKFLVPAFGLSFVRSAPRPSLFAKIVRIEICLRYEVSSFFYAIIISNGLKKRIRIKTFS